MHDLFARDSSVFRAVDHYCEHGEMTKLDSNEIASAMRAAEELARYASERIIVHRPGAGEVWTKVNEADWVTAVDLEIEQHVRDELRRWFPQYGIVGEEFGALNSTNAEECRWFCDPIDGTTNFVHGLPWSSFSLALADEDGLVIGVVCDPYRNELYSAVRGGGAKLNGFPIQCSNAASLVGGIVLSEQIGARSWDGMLEMVRLLGDLQCVTHFMGSSALALANFGAGRASAVALGAANPIDVAAGLIIARESGGLAKGAPGLDAVLTVDSSLNHAALIVGVRDSIGDLAQILS